MVSSVVTGFFRDMDQARRDEAKILAFGEGMETLKADRLR